ncbi:hypothetical protein LWI28_005322 [Acer negundo]|uniref:Uncharacterized protein n=1 Tax=Acer negundo TaxID=4023 RepID=A0AAD5IKN8_ACENE|nr:hypothetical protein LWI28_005322 [Acer negundo]
MELYVDCRTPSVKLHVNCRTTSIELYVDCLTLSVELHVDCRTPSVELYVDCRTTFSKLHVDCRTTFSKLHVDRRTPFIELHVAELPPLSYMSIVELSPSCYIACSKLGQSFGRTLQLQVERRIVTKSKRKTKALNKSLLAELAYYRQIGIIRTICEDSENTSTRVVGAHLYTCLGGPLARVAQATISPNRERAVDRIGIAVEGFVWDLVGVEGEGTLG